MRPKSIICALSNVSACVCLILFRLQKIYHRLRAHNSHRHCLDLLSITRAAFVSVPQLTSYLVPLAPLLVPVSPRL